VTTERVFHPDQRKAAIYDEKLRQYRQIYPALKGWQRSVALD